MKIIAYNMKLFVLVAVLCSTFVLAFGVENGTSEQERSRLKEEEATKYCNSLYPVTEDPRQKVTKIVINGETIARPSTFGTTEWCHLHCFLEKVGFFDAEGGIQYRKILKYVLKIHPEIAPSSTSLFARLFHINRSAKNMEEKCSKAFITYYRFTEAIMVATIAADLTANTEVKEKGIEAVLNEDALPKELQTSIEKSFKNVEFFFKTTVESNANINSTAAPVPAA